VRPAVGSWAVRALAGFLGCLLISDVAAVAAGAGAAVAGRRPGPRHTVVDHAALLRGVRGGVAGEVTLLMDRRARALNRGDRNGFLATVDPLQPGLRAAQSRLFARVRRLPLTDWSFTVVGGGGTAAPARCYPALERRFGAPVFAPAAVLEHYEIRGFDARPTDITQYVVFVERGHRWFFASQTALARCGYRTSADLWDDGPVRSVRHGPVLVLGHPGGRLALATIARRAAAALPAVTAVWGPRWSRRVVILVPATEAEMAAVIDSGGDLSRIAAVATAELSSGQARSAVGDRVVLNPVTFPTLSALGQQVVLTHEVTHVATRADTGPDLPEWLIEGFADYVGFRRSGLPLSSAAGELRQQVSAGDVPVALPMNAEFGGANPDLAAVYEEAWLACRLIAQRDGQAALVRLYRAVGTSRAPAAPALEAALRRIVHLSVPEFTAAWRRYLRAELA
jgi:hypothetical protein